MNYCAFHDLIDWSEYRAGGALDAELWCTMLLRALGCGSELGSSAARTALRIGLISVRSRARSRAAISLKRRSPR